MYTAVKASVLHFSGHTWLIYHLRCQTDFNFHIGSEWKPVSGVASGSKHVVNLSFLTSAMLYICYWDSPGKNTGVGCHFLLQCMKVKRESEVAQLCPTLRDPMDCRPPGSSVHGIFQARVLEWGAIAFSSTYARHVKSLQCFTRNHKRYIVSLQVISY